LSIIVAKTAGFCFGVNKAVRTVYELANEDNREIYTLGPVIHNDQVNDELKKKGVKIIDTVDQANKSGKIVIRAHGIAPEVYGELNRSEHEIIDATCPYVKKIHNLVEKKCKEGYTIIIVGDRNHPEVIGIEGWCRGKNIIVNDRAEAAKIEPSDNKACVVAQTTITRDKWDGVNEELIGKFTVIEKYDTICSATSQRQLEAEKIAKQADIMLVLGSSTSSNTQKLYEICKRHCVNTFKIETFGDLPPMQIKNKVIGITAGASTPEWIIEEVIRKVNELNKDENELSFKEAFESSLVSLHTGDVVEGTIIGFSGNEVYVDLGFKSDGTIPMDEFSDDPDFDPAKSIKVGETVKVFVVRVNDVEGTVKLSKRKIDSIEGFKKIEEAFENKTTIQVKISDVVKGGVVGTANGVRIFIPASQISDKFVKDLNEFVKQTLTVKIIELDKSKRKVVGSRKEILATEKAALLDKVWGEIEAGKSYKGTVKSLTDFGAFVDIGGVDGLIHISELSWNKIKHPSQVVKVGDIVDVYILDFDRTKSRISLGFKKAEDNPWFNAEEKYAVGNVVTGKVVRMVPFGAFIELDKGIDGLVHISQISNVRLAKPSDVLEVGQEVEAKVIELDVNAKKIGLSIKEVKPIDPVKPEEAVAAEAGEELPTEHVEEMENKINIPGELLDNKE